MESYKMWKTFDNDRQESVDVWFSRARREAVERYNEEVRQNREMLKNIVNAVLYTYQGRKWHSGGMMNHLPV